MEIIFIILIVLILFGGLGWGYRSGSYGYPLGGALGIILIILLVWLLVGRGHAPPP